MNLQPMHPPRDVTDELHEPSTNAPPRDVTDELHEPATNAPPGRSGYLTLGLTRLAFSRLNSYIVPNSEAIGACMSDSHHPTKKPRLAEVARLSRRLTCYVVLGICAYAAIQVAIEPFHIPSGSMAPTFRGNHRVAVCPRCGMENVIGRTIADVEDESDSRYYRKAFCENCGQLPLQVAKAPIVVGDKIIVNKTAYWMRSPERWELVVFRLLGTFFIKRVLGLPGEEIQIRNGDLYIDGRLERKDLAQARSMAMLVFDQEHAPKDGWHERWESSNGKSQSGIHVDGRKSPHMLTYRNFSLDNHKCEPIRDEYAYNAGLHADSVCVHDFLVTCDLQVSGGRGVLTLRLTDGQDCVEACLPVGEGGYAELFAFPTTQPEQSRKLSETAKRVSLQAGERRKLEFAFVDRRVTFAIDGDVWLTADLPEAKKRMGVERPFQVQADGVSATLESFKLHRDIHYGQQGINAVRGKSVRLGANQYFMLGDNSPNSEDSRFWPDDGCVNAECLVGSVLYVSRPTLQRR
jgi:signal peptidase I